MMQVAAVVAQRPAVVDSEEVGVNAGISRSPYGKAQAFSAVPRGSQETTMSRKVAQRPGGLPAGT